MCISAAIMGAAMLGTAIVGTSASSSAADAQVESARDANNTELTMFYENLKRSLPWQQAGERSLGTLERMMTEGPGKYEESPGYQFRIGEGQKAIERSAASRGSLQSGGTLKAIERYAQDYATSDYDSFLKRYYDRLRPYQSMANIGQAATAQTNVLGANVASDMSRNTMLAGEARGSQYINQANAITGATNTGLAYYLMNRKS